MVKMPEGARHCVTGRHGVVAGGGWSQTSSKHLSLPLRASYALKSSNLAHF